MYHSLFNKNIYLKVLVRKLTFRITLNRQLWIDNNFYSEPVQNPVYNRLVVFDAHNPVNLALCSHFKLFSSHLAGDPNLFFQQIQNLPAFGSLRVLMLDPGHEWICFNHYST